LARPCFCSVEQHLFVPVLISSLMVDLYAGEGTAKE
jgi:hypothetical protein